MRKLHREFESKFGRCLWYGRNFCVLIVYISTLLNLVAYTHTHTPSLKRPKRSSFLGLSLVWIYIGSFYFLFFKNLVLEQVRSAVLLCSSVQGLPFPSCDGVSIAEPVKGDQECGMEKD